MVSVVQLTVVHGGCVALTPVLVAVILFLCRTGAPLRSQHAFVTSDSQH